MLRPSFRARLGQESAVLQRDAGPVRSAIGLLSRVGLFLVAGVVGSACTPRSTNAEISQTLRSYRSALHADDARAAYDLLSSELQASAPIERFSQQWASRALERSSQQTQLDAVRAAWLRSSSSRSTGSMDEASGVTRSTRLRVSSPGNAPAELVLAKDRYGRWRVAQAELSAPDASTPEAALRGLLAAMEQRSFSAVFRLLSAKTRQAVEEEIQERALRLRNALHAAPTVHLEPRLEGASSSSSVAGIRVEVRGNQARIQYDSRFFIELVRESEGWRIRDMN